MASPEIKEFSNFVHEALESGLHEWGGSQDGLAPIGLANRDGETAGGKAEGDERGSGNLTPRTDSETHGRNERFETIGQRLARGCAETWDDKRVRRGQDSLRHPKTVSVFSSHHPTRAVAERIQQEHPIQVGRSRTSHPDNRQRGVGYQTPSRLLGTQSNRPAGRILRRHIWKPEIQRGTIIPGGHVRRQGERQVNLRFGLRRRRFDQRPFLVLAYAGIPPPRVAFNRQPSRGEEGGGEGA